MTLKELATPIRMYWDIGPTDRLGPADCRRIAREIVDNKFLSLQITETSPVLGEAAFAACEALEGRPLALSLAAFPEALDARALDALRRIPLKIVFTIATSLDELGSVPSAGGRTIGIPAIGLSYPVNRKNFRDLPAVLSYCVDKGIGNLLLPMQRMAPGEECFWLSPQEREELTGQLSRIERPPGVTVTVHDPFLWKVFHPYEEFPGGGCQAANTMLYISPQADVYPCPVMPINLGNLMRSSLGDIVHSELKKEVRKKILAAGRRCLACGEYPACKGGCRGRAYAVHASLQEPDPACS